jgi:DNA-directed RNA polymerase specialized sigma24 family protein
VFNMYVMEGFTHKEIGNMLGISEGTSKWHLSEGRKVLKERIERLKLHFNK